MRDKPTLRREAIDSATDPLTATVTHREYIGQSKRPMTDELRAASKRLDEAFAVLRVAKQEEHAARASYHQTVRDYLTANPDLTLAKWASGGDGE